MKDMTPDVTVRSSCLNCRRPIAYLMLGGAGWVHDELPRYAGQLITCQHPEPADLRCTSCRQPQVTDNVGTIASHQVDGARCPGSGSQGVPLVPGGVQPS